MQNTTNSSLTKEASLFLQNPKGGCGFYTEGSKEHEIEQAALYCGTGMYHNSSYIGEYVPALRWAKKVFMCATEGLLLKVFYKHAGIIGGCNDQGKNPVCIENSFAILAALVYFTTNGNTVDRMIANLPSTEKWPCMHSSIVARFIDTVEFRTRIAEEDVVSVLEDFMYRGAVPNISGINLRNRTLDYKKLRFSGYDLRGADFSGAELVGIDFHGAKVTGAKFEGANLSYANLSDIKGSGVCFANANLTGANISESLLRSPDFSGATMTYCDLSNSFWISPRLSGAHCDKTLLLDAKIINAYMSGATFAEARIVNAVIINPASPLSLVQFCQIFFKPVDLCSPELPRALFGVLSGGQAQELPLSSNPISYEEVGINFEKTLLLCANNIVGFSGIFYDASLEIDELEDSGLKIFRANIANHEKSAAIAASLFLLSKNPDKLLENNPDFASIIKEIEQGLFDRSESIHADVCTSVKNTLEVRRKIQNEHPKSVINEVCKNKNVVLNLSGLNLSCVDLSGTALPVIIRIGSNFENADLSGSNG